MTTPRIYVACLASYNAGCLFGEWMDATVDAEDLSEQVRDMLSKSPASGAEEYAIHDHEGFGGFKVGEYSSLSEVCEGAALITEHGAIFGAACSTFGSVEYAIEAMDRYRGAWESAADYAQEWADDCGELANVPERIQWAIDWDHYANSLQLTEIRIGAEVHIFTE